MACRTLWYRSRSAVAGRAGRAPNSATPARRSRILDEPARPSVWSVLDEAALRRRTGGRQVMAEALRHVTALMATAATAWEQEMNSPPHVPGPRRLATMDA
ncbi:Scr1 family TA system antitoxin-like transcriptional regulator [Streptomyces sp. NPDC056039]|uniref:Scr1 family TA system antitoxin-like transcriptional regulator n=1 Tax=Streptomyces sp. NPDC056039 TaxID=3345687 RepID=UPI0035E32D38